jgi:hypothetical protein
MMTLAELAGLSAIAGAAFAAFMWLFKMATDVAVLKTQMAEVQPVKLARDISWIKGALHSLANVLRADLDEEPK